jgi:acid phosphatase family membrane protein YuiD
MGSKVLLSAFIGWFVAQALKVIFTLIREKKFNINRFVGSGGMPSSHTSLVAAMTTTVARHEGIGSSLFAVSLIFSLIVMYDAAGVRRAAGKQAILLNKLIQDLYHHKYSGDLLKELLGHSPKEVFAGALLGIAIGFLF